MAYLDSAQSGLLAEGLFDLLGPILIFGIYIIASIAKTVAKKGQSENSGEEIESDLKKAVRQRYQEIYQRQVGNVRQDTPESQRPPQNMQSRPMQKPEPAKSHGSQWELQKQAIRHRNANLQNPKPVPKRKNFPKQVAIAVNQSKPVQSQKKRIKQQPRTVEDSQRQPGNLLRYMMNQPENLRSAIILKEILDKPLALREV